MKRLAVLGTTLLGLALLLACSPEPGPPPTPSSTPAPVQEETPAPTPTEEPPTVTEETPPPVETPAPTTPTTPVTPTTPSYPTTPRTTTPTVVPIVWTSPGAPLTLTVDTAANKATFQSGGVEVSGYFYKPAGKGPFPAVLVLHGKGGQNLSTRDRASWFARQGYVAFAPDYFTPIGMTTEKFDVSFYLNSVDPAREVLGQALEALKSLSYVDAARLGVNGYSLGGYLSFILGTRDDVKGIVSNSGAYAPTAPARYPLADICTQIKAPVLMVHGDADTLVPIANANTASELLKSKGKTYEYIVYPGAGHVFDIPGGAGYSAEAAADYQQKMLDFFKAKLQ